MAEHGIQLPDAVVEEAGARIEREFAARHLEGEEVVAEGYAVLVSGGLHRVFFGYRAEELALADADAGRVVHKQTGIGGTLETVPVALVRRREGEDHVD